jgi:hypothetical protein
MRSISAVLAALVFLSACTAYPSECHPLVMNTLVENIISPAFGGKVFCAYDLLNLTEKKERMHVYVWAMCEEYYLDNGTLTMGTGASLPVAVHLSYSGSIYLLESKQIPSDGTFYGSSLRDIFPLGAIRKMCQENYECYNERSARLQAAVKQQAGDYFGIK